MGLTLLVLSGPRLVQDLILAPYSPVLDYLDGADGAALEDFERDAQSPGYKLASRLEKIARYERALRWNDNGRDRLHLAGFYYDAGRLAQESNDEARAKTLFRESAANFRSALAEDPGRPFGWAQLAVALYSAGDNLDPISDVLGQAISAAPYSAKLATPRIQVAYNTWLRLDESTRELARRQVKIAAFLFPLQLARAIRSGRDLYLTRSILEPYPPLLGRFEVALTGRDPDRLEAD